MKKEPGPELDRLVVENVLDWERRTDIWDQEFWVTDDGELGGWRRLAEVEHYPGDAPLFQPSTDISAAMEVLAVILGGPGYETVDLRCSHGKWCVMRPFGRHMAVIPGSVAETLPHAICLAALEVVSPRN